jgi:hypothetical protein
MSEKKSQQEKVADLAHMMRAHLNRKEFPLNGKLVDDVLEVLAIQLVWKQDEIDELKAINSRILNDINDLQFELRDPVEYKLRKEREFEARLR